MNLHLLIKNKNGLGSGIWIKIRSSHFSSFGRHEDTKAKLSLQQAEKNLTELNPKFMSK